MATLAAAASAPPARSNRGDRPPERRPGTRMSAATMRRMPTGTLIAKMPRQPMPNASIEMSHPASTGPTTLAVPVMKPTSA